jgi:hypothetical protein
VVAKWEHWVALGLGALLGSLFGVLTGYVMYALGRIPEAMSLSGWLSIRSDSATGWFAFGVIIGAAVVYTAILIRR